MDIPVHSIAALRKGYAEGRWSVKAVAEAALVRAAAAEAIDPAIWIARVRGRTACSPTAAALDAKGPAGLPLFGVPFAVKDNIDVAGLPTTAACPAFAYQPETFGARGRAAAARPARCWSARPISTSSPPVSSARARPMACRATRSIRATSPAGRAPARRWRWRRASSASRSAPTPPARAASRPPSTTSSA